MIDLLFWGILFGYTLGPFLMLISFLIFWGLLALWEKL